MALLLKLAQKFKFFAIPSRIKMPNPDLIHIYPLHRSSTSDDINVTTMGMV
jgi:hypothetical protein